MKVLVVAAHPDDEVLGCGGTIAKYASQGDEVFVLILGEGITSRYEKREKANMDEIEKLRAQALKAYKILGTKKTFFYNFPDNQMDSVPLMDIIKVVERHIDIVEPEIIFTHSISDLNIDHKITNQAVITATRPYEKNKVKKIYAFEILSSTHWNFSYERMFTPNVFFDISDYLDKKIQAMAAYETEVRYSPHPRSEKIMRALSEFRGSQANLHAAEAFELVREIN
jgi:LmbE family N-acetylglucosaminyl deacetylase